MADLAQLESLPDSERDAAVRTLLQKGCSKEHSLKALETLTNSKANIDLKLEYKYGKRVPINVTLDSDQIKQAAAEVQASFATTNRNVSAAGRARIHTVPSDSSEISEDAPEATLRPWLLAAVIAQAAEEYWSLIVPATLGLIDSPTIVNKVWGCRLASLLVGEHKSRLELRGLLPVFYDALSPSLNYLPPSVPVDDALALNGPAFRALLAFASSDAQVHRAIRDGPFKAIKHAGQNVEFTINVLQSLQQGIRVLAAGTARHFTEIVRLFMTITSDPFIDLSPRLVDTVCETMELAINECGSLVPDHKYDILYGLAKAKALDSGCFGALQTHADLPSQEIQIVREFVASSAS